MLNGNATFGESMPETISIFTKKTHFFRFFGLFSKTPKKFSGPLWPQKNEHHSFFSHFFLDQCICNDKKLFPKKK
jgi:hypothetical protein